MSAMLSPYSTRYVFADEQKLVAASIAMCNIHIDSMAVPMNLSRFILVLHRFIMWHSTFPLWEFYIYASHYSFFFCNVIRNHNQIQIWHIAKLRWNWFVNRKKRNPNKTWLQVYVSCRISVKIDISLNFVEYLFPWIFLQRKIKSHIWLRRKNTKSALQDIKIIV